MHSPIIPYAMTTILLRKNMVNSWYMCLWRKTSNNVTKHFVYRSILLTKIFRCNRIFTCFYCLSNWRFCLRIAFDISLTPVVWLFLRFTYGLGYGGSSGMREKKTFWFIMAGDRKRNEEHGIFVQSMPALTFKRKP